MAIYFKNISNILILTILLWLLLPLYLFAQAHDDNIIIHLLGVYESKVSLLALSGSGTFKPIGEVKVLKNGQTTKITVSKEYLPGEFVLRFDYKEKEASTSYPSEKYIFY